MDLRFTSEEIAFRDEVRTFCRTEIPAEIRRKVSEGRSLTKDDYVTSQRILNAKGWAVPHWPQEWGGRDWTPIQRYIYTEELFQAAVPLPQQFNCYMFGPVLATFGRQDQKERFLPRAANLDDWWCQGFSEPGAGSDLASLKTKAVRDGDHYVVDGQKTWTTLGQHADWIFCLVRTDFEAKKQRGISFLLIDMKTAGITVRPILTLEGRHEVNEVFFDQVRVPAANLVGQENRGWDYAKFLLGNERVGVAPTGQTKALLARAKSYAADSLADGTTLLDDQLIATRIAALENDLLALELTQLRVVANSEEGKPHPASSVMKLRGTELQQEVTELVVDLAGPQSVASFAGDDSELPEWVKVATPTYLNYRKASIYGGSNEVQRTIIATSILGL